jgi:predicted phage terminase large subunit-like protein
VFVPGDSQLNSEEALAFVLEKRDEYQALVDPTHPDHYQKTILDNPYIPHKPTEKQREFLHAREDEILYGGAAGGGKSDALLMAALQYVLVPGYHALLIRRTYMALSLKGALMDRASDWLYDTDARWNGTDKRWTFPTGSTLTFGYLDTVDSEKRYQGAEFHFIGYDELTQFREHQYLYLFSRRRGLDASKIPIRTRAASNPGGIGHEWVKERFIIGDKRFIPASLYDNPYLDQAEYRAGLEKLDPVTRAQLLEGDWDASLDGGWFETEQIRVQRPIPIDTYGWRWLRYWDMAATEKKSGKDPDYTVGLLLGVKDGLYHIRDVYRDQRDPAGTEKMQSQTRDIDGPKIPIREEEEGGSSGKNVIFNKARTIYQGYNYKGIRSTGSKVDRSKPVAAAISNGLVSMAEGEWNKEFIRELKAFPMGVHDDQVDALSGAFNELFHGKNNSNRFMTYARSDS